RDGRLRPRRPGLMTPTPPRAPADARLAIGARALGVPFPLVQAGMGGVAGPRLAAAVSAAGALGTVALYRSPAARCTRLVERTAALTDRPFAVGVVPEVAGTTLLAEQLTAVLAAADRPLVLSSFGPPPAGFAAAVRAAGHLLLVQVGSPAQARAAVRLGADVLALQGAEAGGRHLGELAVRRLLAAVLADRPGVPLLVAGGLEHGGQLRAAAAAGAHGALAGTLFAAAAESDAHPEYQRALVAAGPGATVVTDRFALGWPGRRHRVLAGPVTDAAAPPPAAIIGWLTEDGVRHPVPRGAATVPTVRVEGSIDQMARYAGTGSAAIRAVAPAAVLVDRLRAQAQANLPSPNAC
ncbi:NAD(P)H-dependent flavin oxidoreductase, partial [Kitasatospora sp. LaBMicrA B282]|uniref:NAD(P)H-dependent flavin oxidoreductase n=1 Tax=Kitasatospora sp. LaBMicrA B282 TaxID=3420949 RepID=UPI003D146138